MCRTVRPDVVAVVAIVAVLATGCGGHADHRRADTTTAATPPATSAATAASPSDSTVGAAVPTAAQVSGSPANAGYDEPENLAYDGTDNVYLVSNIVGGPTDADHNGFISRVGPDGRVLTLKWIDGSNAATRLDGPKGIAIHGDTIAVADITTVRLFDRRTGKSLGAWTIPQSQMLNDLAFAPDGSIYVTDTGPQGGSAVYRVTTAGQATPVARDTSLDGPDGIVVSSTEIIYATFGANRLVRIPLSVNGTAGTPVTMDTLPAGKVDGLRRLPDGSLVVTSWDAHTVYRRMPDGTRRPILTEVRSPAGVAYDAAHNRLAITSMQDNRLYLIPVH